MPDAWEIIYNPPFNPTNSVDGLLDSDGDGLTNKLEYIFGCNPTNSDTDVDGMLDGWEVANGLNPLLNDSVADPDSDGVSNLAEYLAGTDPQDMDEDNDGMPNAWETANGLDLLTDDSAGDADSDGLTNVQEYEAQTDPQFEDSDNDRLTDWEELNTHQTDPSLKDTDDDGAEDWFELDQGIDPLVDEFSVPEEEPMEALGEPLAMAASSWSDFLADDFNDNGQLNIDELHRYPVFTIEAQVITNKPVGISYNGASVLIDTYYSGFGAGVYSYHKVLYGKPGVKYSIDELLGRNVDLWEANHTLLYPSVHIVADVDHAVDDGGFNHTTPTGGHIYPFSCSYRIEKEAAGLFGRKMSIPINDDDDNEDGTPDCENEIIDSSEDTNDMGRVVFEQLDIHSDAPAFEIFVNASTNLRVFRVDNGQVIEPYSPGTSEPGAMPWDPPIVSPPSGDNIYADLIAGDLAVWVEGLSVSTDPNQTADSIADNGRWYLPFYSIPNPTSGGSWGTYLGLYYNTNALSRYPYFTNDLIRFSVEVKPDIAIIPDWNRDRQIDINEKGSPTNVVPYRFWINDDADSGDIAEGNSDIPGQGGKWNPLKNNANYEDKKVNGRSDLTDFFPVWLRLESALETYPSGGDIEYRLRHYGEDLRFVYTDLARDQAGDYLITDVTSCGSDFNQNVYEADAVKVKADGVVLNSSFLSRIVANPDKGVLLIESIGSTAFPLELTVVSNGTVLVSAQLPLRTSSVEFMFRHKNIRPDGAGMPDRDSSAAINELLSNGKNFVFVHGYNVNEQQARGWQSTLFKRMFWSGSNARFHGVTWCGDQSQVRIPILGTTVTPNYHVNVLNALNSAQGLKTYLDSLSGETVVAAHSLGNMMTGAAVARWYADVDKWFMIDGAVAIENFDGSSSVQNTNMIHPDWVEYTNRVWASEWHVLFGVGDYRKQLTWRGYFADAVSKVWNFYSSGEDVLKTHVGDPGPLDYATGGEAWCLQEKRKGRNWISSTGGSTHGGWGFNEEYEGYTPVQAAGISTNVLKTIPFFRPGNGFIQNLYEPHNGSDFAGNYIYEFLAGFVPSRTLPCGANVVDKFNPPNQPSRNFNMNDMQNGWPQGRLGDLDKEDRWLHSDIREISYLYVYEVFDEFITQGGLE